MILLAIAACAVWVYKKHTAWGWLIFTFGLLTKFFAVLAFPFVAAQVIHNKKWVPAVAVFILFTASLLLLIPKSVSRESAFIQATFTASASGLNVRQNAGSLWAFQRMFKHALHVVDIISGDKLPDRWSQNIKSILCDERGNPLESFDIKPMEKPIFQAIPFITYRRFSLAVLLLSVITVCGLLIKKYSFERLSMGNILLIYTYSMFHYSSIARWMAPAYAILIFFYFVAPVYRKVWWWFAIGGALPLIGVYFDQMMIAKGTELVRVPFTGSWYALMYFCGFGFIATAVGYLMLWKEFFALGKPVRESTDDLLISKI